MRVRLNLATKPLVSHRRFLAGSGLVAFAAAVVLVALSWHVYVVRKADADIRKRMEQMNQEVTKYEARRRELEGFFARKDIASLHDRSAFLNSIIDARSFNWTQMFMDLEHILPAGVHVLQIEPKQAAGHAELKLTVGATSEEAELKFFHALEQSKEFSDLKVQLVRTPNPGANLAGDAMVVQLTASYLGS